MKSSQPYKLGIRGLSLIVFFRLVLLMYLYYKINSIAVNYRFPVTRIFTWLEIGMLMLVLIEAFIYGWLQSRVQTKLWVRLHVWCLAVELFLMPVVMMGLVFILQLLNREESAAIIKSIRWLKFYMVWVFMIAGHGAFIVVLVKSLSKKNKVAPTEEPGGILDEFTTE